MKKQVLEAVVRQSIVHKKDFERIATKIVESGIVVDENNVKVVGDAALGVINNMSIELGIAARLLTPGLLKKGFVYGFITANVLLAIIAIGAISHSYKGIDDGYSK